MQGILQLGTGYLAQSHSAYHYPPAWVSSGTRPCLLIISADFHRSSTFGFTHNGGQPAEKGSTINSR